MKHKLHNMKQLLALIFAARLLICAEQPPPPTVTTSYQYDRYQAGNKPLNCSILARITPAPYKIGLKGDISLRCATHAESG